MLAVGGALVLAGWLSPVSLLVVFQNGSIACGIVLAATGLGLWIGRALRLQDVEVRWQLLLAAGLGLGALCLLMLGLGLAGVMNRSIWLGLLAAGLVSGYWPARRLVRSAGADDEERPGHSGGYWFWLVAAGFGGLALVAATFPPGILWPAEGNGYDVLEYHLGVPREYFEAGRIDYLPHNIYSNFPFNVEMLYLLTIVLHADPLAAVFTAQMMNVLLGVLAVAAIWLAGREFGRAAGLVAGLAAATCPFLTYLCGVAYVENGMLFWTALALAATLRAGRSPAASGRWWLAAGLACGLVCGCKHTVLPMVFAPLAAAAASHALRGRLQASPVAPASRRWHVVGFILFLAGSAAAFAPWLMKNAAMTGNPVFPLARSVFPERAGVWNDDGAARWHEGHLPAPEDRPLARRLSRLWQEILTGSSLFGPMIGLGLILGAAALPISLRRLRQTQPAVTDDRVNSEPSVTACWLMILVGLVFWLGWTHVVGRFAVTLIAPVAVLLGAGWETLRTTPARRPVGVALTILLAYHAYTSGSLLYPALAPQLEAGIAGNATLLPKNVPHILRLNELVGAGRRVLMVGDARRFYLNRGVDYCVVFNRNLFAEAAAARAPGELTAWLREQGYDYVYVDWIEMHRLRSSRYGFWASIDAELFRRLSIVGLRPVEDFAFVKGGAPYSTLYEVSPRG